MTGRGGLDPIALAAADNARWCDAVCRAHGLRTVMDPSLWRCEDPPPRFYPSAVTLTDGPGAETALRSVLASRPDLPGGVKDSFLALDLATDGYAELFRARWLWRVPVEPGPASLAWARVATDAELAAWEVAWNGGAAPADVPRVFPPALLEDAGIAFMAGRRGGRIVAVSVLSRTGPVVGLSNATGTDPASDHGWADHARVAAAVFPGLPLVGYEHGDDLAAAQRHGFLPVGELRVWVPAPG